MKWSAEGNIEIYIRIKKQGQKNKNKYMRVNIENTQVQGSFHLKNLKFWVGGVAGPK